MSQIELDLSIHSMIEKQLGELIEIPEINTPINNDPVPKCISDVAKLNLCYLN